MNKTYQRIRFSTHQFNECCSSCVLIAIKERYTSREILGTPLCSEWNVFPVVVLHNFNARFIYAFSSSKSDDSDDSDDSDGWEKTEEEEKEEVVFIVVVVWRRFGRARAFHRNRR